MPVKKLVAIILTIASLASGPASAQTVENIAAKPIAESERCPVCGMYPAKYSKWHAQIVFKNGEHTSFDSAAEMFRFLNNMKKYDNKHIAADIAKIFVPAYNTGDWLDAKQAFYIAGSKAKGPMGNDFPAFAKQEDANRFIQKFGGNVLGFEQVTPALLNGSHHMHSH